MARNPPPTNELIDLTDSPPTSPVPGPSSDHAASLPTRASTNNPNQPVSLPTFGDSTAAMLGSSNEAVDLTDDVDEDEDLKRAIALSLESHQEQQHSAVTEVMEDTDSPEQDPRMSVKASETIVDSPKQEASIGNAGFGLLGLDRKAMEQERLMRLKRKREPESVDSVSKEATIPIPTTSNGKRPKPSEPGTTRVSAATRNISPPPMSRLRAAPLDSIDLQTTGSSKSASRKTIVSSPTLQDAPTASAKKISSFPQPSLYTFPTLLRTYSSLEASVPCTKPLLPITTLSTLLTSPISKSTKNLTSALLSSSTFDFDYFLPLFNTTSTKFVFILHTTSSAHQKELLASFSGVDNVRLVFPKPIGGMAGFGTMHSKVGALFYSPEDNDRWKYGRCRLFIPTSNLVAYDWGENGSVAPAAPPQAKENAKKNIENLVWVVDLPLGAPGAPMGSETHLQQGLIAYLSAQDVPPAVIEKLRLVDFSATEGVGWVGSQAGFHYPKSTMTKGLGSKAAPAGGTGAYELSSTVRALGLAAHEDEEVQVEFLTSSLGSLTSEWLATFYEAVCGRLGSDGDEEPASSASATRVKKSTISMPTMPATKKSTSTSNATTKSTTTSSKPQQQQQHERNIRIYFPARETVKNSFPGPAGAGTIRFNDQWWDRPAFPRSNIRNAVSVVLDGKGLMHAKLVAVRFAKAREAVEKEGDAQGDDGMTGHGKRTGKGKVLLGYCYVGSANCSESAWGRIITAKDKLTIRNWEAGVVFPVYAAAATAAERRDEAADIQPGDEVTIEEFVRAMPLPMRVPGESLVGSGSGSGQRPWSGIGGGGGGFGAAFASAGIGGLE